MASKKRRVPNIYVIIDADGQPLEGWFASATSAREAIRADMLDEHRGPVRVLRFVAQEEQPK